MRFYFFNHQNKGMALIQALKAAGHTLSAQSGSAEIIFTDVDVPPRAANLASLHQRGKKIFVYPHAARPNLFHDFDNYPPFPHVTAHFVPAEGNIEILRQSGLPHALEVIGWYLCPMRPFQPRGQARKVLFAPIHPNANGTLPSVDRQTNTETFKKLLPLVESGDIELTVRFLRGLEKNGLWTVEGVTYIEGKPDQSYQEIDAADLVVSHQTMGHIAVARGVPTVMMGESTTPHLGSDETNNLQYARNWEKYRDLLRFPLDILVEDDTRALFQRAVQSDEEIADWRCRLIGQPFDGQRFVRALERYV